MNQPSMTHRSKAILINLATVAGLAIERWRGAPWIAILITAAIFFPMANTLMYLKHRRQLRSFH